MGLWRWDASGKAGTLVVVATHHSRWLASTVPRAQDIRFATLAISRGRAPVRISSSIHVIVDKRKDMVADFSPDFDPSCGEEDQN